MKITLAPMEGVADYLTRQLLAATGGFDLCVTEFVRITSTLYPNNVFYRMCPELHHGSRTRCGTPVHVQLLGSDPVLMAESACKVARLGALGIDLNFGCPSKTVNRHKGGASLLKEPETIYTLVSAVRRQLPEHIPLTAKMRLGYDDPAPARDIALGIEAAGANGLTIHARTRKEGYRPPAHWHLLAEIGQQLGIPLTANGEIWTVDDYHRCRDVSGCDSVMLGRGAVARPLLARQIRDGLREQPHHNHDWLATRDILQQFAEQVLAFKGNDSQQFGINDPHRYLADRIKQWLGLISRSHQQAATLFHSVKREKCPNTILSQLQAAA